MLAILEAAERVRLRRDPTKAMRSRQWRGGSEPNATLLGTTRATLLVLGVT
jgi:hypothetical protein